MLYLYYISWWARLDSNQRPMDYESTALTAELQARKLEPLDIKIMTEVFIELSDHDFMRVAELAHKNNITFDQQVQEIMIEYIEQHEEKLPDQK